MGKRANNEGSVYQRKDGRWVATALIAGKTRGYYGHTQTEAVRKRDEAKKQEDAGLWCEPSKLTLEAWLAHYRDDILPIGKSPRTVETDRTEINVHLIPALGPLRLQDKRLADHIQSFIRDLQKKELASSTIRRIYAVLRKALEVAVDRRYIPRVPKTTLPKVERKEVPAYTEEEIALLLPYLPDTTQGRALHFILGTGLRVSELCGLRWKDVKDGVLHVKQETSIIRGEIVTTSPKSQAGIREIPLGRKLQAILDEQKRKQRIERMSAGPAWHDGDYIFATKTGKPADRNNLARCLKNALKKADLPEYGPHGLRHTFASRWIEAGHNVRTLSETIGHSDVGFTLKTYCHSSDAAKRKGIESIENLL